VFYYVYVLQSGKDGNRYVGYTNNLRKRVEQHQAGQVPSTATRLPMQLVYCEGCLNQSDALEREKYLKTAWGKRYLKNRMQHYLTG
jgi:putative endonuclease